MRIVFVGTGAIGVPTLHALQTSSHQLVGVVTQPDKPVGRDQRIQAPPIKQAAKGGVPIFQPRRIKEEAAIEQIRNWQPDVIVVMAYGQILPSGVLDAPRLACINLHASLLPKWRGAAPIQAAIAAGDNETGITVMHVDEGLDTGDIVLQKPIPILATDTGAAVHDRMAEIAPDILFEALERIEKGDAPRKPQDSTEASYAPKLNRESGRIDWSEPAEVIERKIRAFNPWPGMFAEVSTPSGRRKLKAWSASVVERQGQRGQILSTGKELIVGAGARAISLNEVQLEGRKRMSAAEFLRGNEWIKNIASF